MSTVSEAMMPTVSELLLTACRQNQVDEVRSLLRQTAVNVTSPNQHGLSAVHMAAIGGSCSVLELLLDHNACMAAALTPAGWTPLHFAVQRRRSAIAALLLDRGADVNAAASGTALTPLHLAARRGTVEMTRMLLQRGASVDVVTRPKGDTALHLAAKIGRGSRIVELLCAGNADVNAVNTKGRSALYEASLRGHTRVITELLARGASPALPGLCYCNPLAAAIKYDHAETVRLLLTNGSCPSQEIVYPAVEAPVQPIHMAVLSPRCTPRTVRALLAGGADVEARVRCTMPVTMAGPNGGAGSRPLHVHFGTPLLLATLGARRHLVEALCIAGCDVDVTCQVGLLSGTALHVAVERRLLDVSHVLLEHGASPESKVFRVFPSVIDRLKDPGATCLTVAVRKGYSDMVRLLLKYGASVNGGGGMQGCGLASPLHAALSVGDGQLVRLLLDHGADVTFHPQSGVSVTHTAVTSFQPDILHVLLRHGAPLNAISSVDQTALQDALRKSHYGTAITLVRHGAKLQVSGSRPWGNATDVRIILDLSDSSYSIFGALIDSGVEVHLLVKTLEFMLREPVWVLYLKDRRRLVSYMRAYLHGPRTLRQLCRLVVRRTLIGQGPDQSIWRRLDKLPLPVPLIEYLTLVEFEHQCQAEGEQQDYSSGY